MCFNGRNEAQAAQEAQKTVVYGRFSVLSSRMDFLVHHYFEWLKNQPRRPGAA
jgi:hypothetical protein